MMSEPEQILSKLSGATKAQIIVNEYLIGNLDIPTIKEIFDYLAKSDLEKIGMLELIKTGALEQNMEEDATNSLIGALSSDVRPQELPIKKERKTITVKPFNPPISKQRENSQPPPPPALRYPGQRRKRTTGKIITQHNYQSSESTQTTKIKNTNIKNDAFFGGSTGTIRNKINSFSKPTILIADDDPRIRMIFKMKIQGAGYSIIEAENGNIAWDIINEGKLDGLVMDMKMPGLHGLEILAKMSKISSKLPVCICSAYDQLKDEFVIKNYPMIKYFVKPVDAEELVDAIKTMVPVKN